MAQMENLHQNMERMKLSRILPQKHPSIKQITTRMICLRKPSRTLSDYCPKPIKSTGRISMVHKKITINDVERDLLKLNQFRKTSRMYIKCTSKQCGKWRYREGIKNDPTLVPDDWKCEHGGFSCCQPQAYINEKDLIENKYHAGSLVWAKCDNYPWWPAIVCDDAEVLQYYELPRGSKIPKKYHIMYLEGEGDERYECDWLEPSKLKPFNPAKTNTADMRKERRGLNQCLQRRKDAAFNLCLNIHYEEEDIFERLQKYGYMAFLMYLKQRLRKH